MIKDKLSTVKERSKALNAKMREHFNANESKIIREWEKQTGMSWPKLSNGSRATPHHVIPIKNGGSNEWWNIIPVQHPHTGLYMELVLPLGLIFLIRRKVAGCGIY